VYGLLHDQPLGFDPRLLNALEAIDRAAGFCASYPLQMTVRLRLEARAEMRWVQATTEREGLSFGPQDVAQMLLHNRPPRRHKDAAVVVRGITAAGKTARYFGAWNSAGAVGAGLLGRLRRDISDDETGYRRTSSCVHFLLGAPREDAEVVGRECERLFNWLSSSAWGENSVFGVAIAHQELMHLCPFRDYSIPVVDATTRCLLAQRRIDVGGLSVIEREFADDFEKYRVHLRDRSEQGRIRWVGYFASCLANALDKAASDVRAVSQHVNREPWLEARPLGDREQKAYAHVLRQRKATSEQVLKALELPPSSLRTVQRILVRLGEIGLVEKVGARKDAYYRPVGVVPQLEPGYEDPNSPWPGALAEIATPPGTSEQGGRRR
jgi:hypothetical protein